MFVLDHSGQEYDAIVIAGMFLLFAKLSFFLSSLLNFASYQDFNS